jgi:hypothetical protein
MTEEETQEQGKQLLEAVANENQNSACKNGNNFGDDATDADRNAKKPIG